MRGNYGRFLTLAASAKIAVGFLQRAVQERGFKFMIEEFIVNLKREARAFQIHREMHKKYFEEINKRYGRLGTRTLDNWGIYGFEVCDICGKRKEFKTWCVGLASHGQSRYFVCGDCRKEFSKGNGQSDGFVYVPKDKIESVFQIRGFRLCKICAKPDDYDSATNGKVFVCRFCRKRFAGITDWNKFVTQIDRIFYNSRLSMFQYYIPC